MRSGWSAAPARGRRPNARRAALARDCLECSRRRRVSGSSPRRQRSVHGAKFDGGQALGTRSDPRFQLLARNKLAQARVANRLHMDEDVLLAIPLGAAAIDETIALDAIEPLDLHRLEFAGRVGKRLAVGSFAG